MRRSDTIARMASSGLKVGALFLAFVAAAVLEVGGDAIIRKGLVGARPLVILAGFILLGSYGIIVNLLPFDFSRVLGVYIGVFAVVSVATGRFVFQETIATSTWLGVGVVLVGSLIVQFGSRL
jgi:drug/metabolite transporter superfamily protein YnfA